MKLRIKLLLWAVAAFFAFAVIGAMGLFITYLVIADDLPEVEVLKEVQYEVPLRVYSQEGLLLADYGEKRRNPVSIDKVPGVVRQAFLAAEDDGFETHHGISITGLVRAAIDNALTGRRGQGASTITMQVARNFFLNSEKTYTRKLREIFLAIKIERELEKDEILELYLNKIYFGHRAYGVGAAAQVYYGIGLDGLTLAQAAMIAGLPKAPSRNNPIDKPGEAKGRRDWVLNRMLKLDMIEQAAHDAAVAAPLTASLHSPRVQVSAPYVGEMVRAKMVERYGDKATMAGYKVYTSIRAEMQVAANEAVRTGLIAYDLRHGYRGAEARLEIDVEKDDPQRWDERLKDYRQVGGLRAALVTGLEEQSAKVYLGRGEWGRIPWEGMVWARKHINENAVGPEPKKAAQFLAVGDVVRVVPYIPEDKPEEKDKEAPAHSEEALDAEPDMLLALRQIPEVSGALVSLNPIDGGVNALIGGFDFSHSKFNRAVQAQRQPGSSFKPFIYSAALEKDYTPASIVNDAPVVFEDSALEDVWRPENYSGKFYGPTRLRVALTKSRNLVSIRILRSMGIPYAHRYISNFGFNMERLPRNLSLALGSGAVTPIELARGYAVFANGGYLVKPYFIDRIESEDGRVLYRSPRTRVCPPPCELEAAQEEEPQDTPEASEEVADQTEPPPLQAEGTVQDAEPVIKLEKDVPAERVIAAENAYQIVSMMQSVIREGTGARARALGRKDLSGKTGTSNDQNDAWFSGYNADIVTTVWVGFDKLQPLGGRETGAGAALPLWVDFMGKALKDRPNHALRQPRGMVTVKIDPQSGLLASASNPQAIFETFRSDRVPSATAYDTVPVGNPGDPQEPAEMPEQLF